jgi:3-dehydrosphinganine reductase
MSKLNFREKNIVVTGGTQGIGKEICIRLANEGANLFIIARKEKNINILLKDLKKNNPQGKFWGFAADVSEYNQVKNAVKDIKKNMGIVYGLVSNAGVAIPRYFIETPVSEFEMINKVKYLGSVYMTRELYPLLSDGGFISFTSSFVGSVGVFGYSSYAGPNFALMGFAEVLLQEFASRKIQVSVLCPADTDTPGYTEELKTVPFETKKISGNVKIMTPDQVAGIFLKKLKKGNFVITVNFDSKLMFILKRILGEYMVKIMAWMITGYQKNKK